MFNFEQMYATTEEMWFVNWVTPILVIHGEKDFRVPPGQGLAAFNSAVLRDVPAKLLYFPEENHWVLQP